MPGVRAFGRHWQIASDDLLIPAVIGVIMHSIWFLLLIVNSLHVAPSAGCSPQGLLYTYLWLNGGIAIILLSLEAIIGWTSFQGCVADDRPRRSLKYWIPMHAVLVIMDSLTQCLGIYLLAGPQPLSCSNSRTATILTQLSVSIGILFLLVWSLIIAYLFISSSPLKRTHVDYRDLWNRRLQWLCFGHRDRRVVNRRFGYSASTGGISGSGVTGGQQGVGDAAVAASMIEGDLLSDIARVFADVFNDAETVGSDVLVGLIYVRKKQHLQRRKKNTHTSQDNGNAPQQETLHSINKNTRSQTPSSIQTATTSLSHAPSTTPLIPPSEFRQSARRLSSPTQFLDETNVPLDGFGNSSNGSNGVGMNVDGAAGINRMGRKEQAVRGEEIKDIAHFIDYAEAIYGL
ncbi:hypothetical protein HDU76_013891 [Blyttiomyces sp. JEL0837]|nr:hypothetical protein HDU76_013891 [Blyttiomyces sp. JEL0837]